MSYIYYKFKSNIEYDTVKFDGLHMSLEELKDNILQQKKMTKGGNFTLQIINAQNKEEYKEEKTLIPKNTSVIVARIPISIQIKKNQEKLARKHFNYAEPMEKITRIQDKSSDFKKITQNANLANMDITEEEKIKAMMAQATQDFDPNLYPNAKFKQPPPQTYVCFKCHQPGHWIQFCPYITDSNFESRIKRSTGIPKSFMTLVDGPGVKGALLTNEGKFAVPKIDKLAYQEKKKERPPFLPPEQDGEVTNTETYNSMNSAGSADQNQHAAINDIHIFAKTMIKDVPSDFKCGICQNIMQDAVVVPCCGNSFCDECITKTLLDQEDHICPTCHECDQLPSSLIPNQKLRKAIDTFVATRFSSWRAQHNMPPLVNGALPGLTQNGPQSYPHGAGILPGEHNKGSLGSLLKPWEPMKYFNQPQLFSINPPLSSHNLMAVSSATPTSNIYPYTYLYPGQTLTQSVSVQQPLSGGIYAGHYPQYPPPTILPYNHLTYPPPILAHAQVYITPPRSYLPQPVASSAQNSALHSIPLSHGPNLRVSGNSPHKADHRLHSNNSHPGTQIPSPRPPIEERDDGTGGGSRNLTMHHTTATRSRSPKSTTADIRSSQTSASTAGGVHSGDDHHKIRSGAVSEKSLADDIKQVPEGTINPEKELPPGKLDTKLRRNSLTPQRSDPFVKVGVRGRSSDPISGQKVLLPNTPSSAAALSERITVKHLSTTSSADVKRTRLRSRSPRDRSRRPSSGSGRHSRTRSSSYRSVSRDNRHHQRGRTRDDRPFREYPPSYSRSPSPRGMVSRDLPARPNPSAPPPSYSVSFYNNVLVPAMALAVAKRNHHGPSTQVDRPPNMIPITPHHSTSSLYREERRSFRRMAPNNSPTLPSRGPIEPYYDRSDLIDRREREETSGRPDSHYIHTNVSHHVRTRPRGPLLPTPGNEAPDESFNDHRDPYDAAYESRRYKGGELVPRAEYEFHGKRLAPRSPPPLLREALPDFTGHSLKYQGPRDYGKGEMRIDRCVAHRTDRSPLPHEFPSNDRRLHYGPNTPLEDYGNDFDRNDGRGHAALDPRDDRAQMSGQESFDFYDGRSNDAGRRLYNQTRTHPSGPQSYLYNTDSYDVNSHRGRYNGAPHYQRRRASPPYQDPNHRDHGDSNHLDSGERGWSADGSGERDVGRMRDRQPRSFVRRSNRSPSQPSSHPVKSVVEVRKAINLRGGEAGSGHKQPREYKKSSHSSERNGQKNQRTDGRPSQRTSSQTGRGRSGKGNNSSRKGEHRSEGTDAKGSSTLKKVGTRASDGEKSVKTKEKVEEGSIDQIMPHESLRTVPTVSARKTVKMVKRMERKRVRREEKLKRKEARKAEKKRLKVEKRRQEEGSNLTKVPRVSIPDLVPSIAEVATPLASQPTVDTVLPPGNDQLRVSDRVVGSEVTFSSVVNELLIDVPERKLSRESLLYDTEIYGSTVVDTEQSRAELEDQADSLYLDAIASSPIDKASESIQDETSLSVEPISANAHVELKNEIILPPPEDLMAPHLESLVNASTLLVLEEYVSTEEERSDTEPSGDVTAPSSPEHVIGPPVEIVTSKWDNVDESYDGPVEKGISRAVKIPAKVPVSADILRKAEFAIINKPKRPLLKPSYALPQPKRMNLGTGVGAARVTDPRPKDSKIPDGKAKLDSGLKSKAEKVIKTTPSTNSSSAMNSGDKLKRPTASDKAPPKRVDSKFKKEAKVVSPASDADDKVIAARSREGSVRSKKRSKHREKKKREKRRKEKKKKKSEERRKDKKKRKDR